MGKKNGRRDTILTGKDIILTVLAIIVIGLIVWVKSARPADVNLLDSFEDGKVNVYRVVDNFHGVVCYVAVGSLHGRTVAINCIQESGYQQKF